MAPSPVLFNPRYGRIGLIGLPYYFFVEWLSVMIEMLGWIFLVVLWWMYPEQTSLFLLWMLVTFLTGSFLSALALLLTEWTYHRQPRLSHLFCLYLWAWTESLWYRPFLLAVRLEGKLSALSGETAWGEMEREGLSGSA